MIEGLIYVLDGIDAQPELAEQGDDGPNDDDELEPSPRSGHRKIDQSGWAPGEELDLEEDNSDCESSLGSLEHDDQTRW